MKTNIHFRSYLAQFFLEWKMFQTKVVNKPETHCIFNNFFRKSCHLWDKMENVVERGRSQMTIWRMCIACWIPKATNTYTGCVMLIAFPLQQWLQERAPMLRYYIRCRVLFLVGTLLLWRRLWATEVNWLRPGWMHEVWFYRMWKKAQRHFKFVYC
jgi:hypothetical protein